MSELLALGISHKTAPVALRERLAVDEAEAGQFARTLAATPETREAVVHALYPSSQHLSVNVRTFIDFLAKRLREALECMAELVTERAA